MKRPSEIDMPTLGLGTYKLHKAEAVRQALDIGYRHIDTAEYYRNEEMIGEVLASHQVPREEVFITSKVWNNHHGYQPARDAAANSLQQLGTDYFDLYLIHWPRDDGRRLDTWHAFEEMLQEGRSRAIGVSNFESSHIEDILQDGDVPPAVNQIELHPWNYQQQKSTIDFCWEHDIIVEAYSPLNQGSGWGNPTLQAVAASHDAHPTQILIAWSLQHDFVCIPKASSREHLLANFQAAELTLSDEEMHDLDTL
ncbi:MAG: aldo/keto reductase [Anaerolineae bacterium]